MQHPRYGLPDPAARRVLAAGVFAVGTCSIVYELLVSTTAAYFLGDSVTQFSLTIGVYMAAMGLGSYLARFLTGDPLRTFVRVELALGVVGALSVPTLYAHFGFVGYAGFQAVTLGVIAAIGVMTGLEIPLLTRLLAPLYAGDRALSNVLTLDYVGALAATLLFPFVLLPLVGVYLSSVLFGAVNVAVATYTAYRFRRALGSTTWMGVGVALLLALGGVGALAESFLGYWRGRVFRDPVVYAEQTPYQSLSMTRAGDDVRLYIDRVIQWSSRDEYRYHESLVHPVVEFATAGRAGEGWTALVLGGGEGLAVRELLKYERLDRVDVVDIDPAIFALGATHRDVVRVNGGALLDARVTATAEDAFAFLARQVPSTRYDVIVVDLPDPTTLGVARLYSVEFFRLCRRVLRPGGALATQATSPVSTPLAFRCIGETLAEAGLATVTPYHTYVNSFGDWGFYLAAEGDADVIAPPSTRGRVSTRYYSPEQWLRDRAFPRDLAAGGDVAPNRLDRPVLLGYYDEDYRRYARAGETW